MRGRTLLIVLALAGACARVREPIGIAPSGDLPAFVCPPDPTPAAVAEPPWSCGPGCLATAGADPARFASATVSTEGRPEVVYPPTGSVHPVNLGAITLQWRRPPGAGQTFFRLRLEPVEGGGAAVDFYVPRLAPGTPPDHPEEESVFSVPPEYWRYLGQRNAGRTVRLTITGLDPALDRVATSAPVELRFTSGPVEGTLDYVTAVDRVLRRHSFGSSNNTVLLSPGTPDKDVDCVGCHSASRDGATFAYAGTYAGTLGIARAAAPGNPLHRGPLGSSEAVAPALRPDGQRVLARSGDAADLGVTLRDAGGVVLDRATRAQMGGRIDFPEWSPLGHEVVAARSTSSTAAEQYSAEDGHLVVIPVAGDRIGAPRVLAEDPTRQWQYGNPSFSPDGRWIVFVARPAGQASYGNPIARLRLLERATGAITPLGLALPDRASTYPKIAPVMQDRCTRLYFVFQSRLDYGLVLVEERLADRRTPALWLAEIDLARLGAAGDVMSAPVWLPFQTPGAKYILPAWSAP